MILIHPPVVKPCQPPAGIAKLAGVMNHHNVRCAVMDANSEGIASILHSQAVSPFSEPSSKGGSVAGDPPDRWTMRARRHLQNNITALTSWSTYGNVNCYKQAVIDVNHVLEMSSPLRNIRLNLSNYLDRGYSPVKSADLIRMSEMPERNPFYPYFKKRLFPLLEREQPAVVGFSLNYLSQAMCTFSMVGMVKREYPGVKIVLGGGLVTSWMSRPGWTNPFQGFIDEMVAGPGEDTLLSMFGIHRGEDHVIPDYSLLNQGSYLSPGPILPYSASSGCYWNRCSFCPERAEGNPYRPVNVNRVLSDLDALVAKYEPLLIHLLDNAISPALLEALTVRSQSVPWYGFARISPLLADLQFCMALRRSGCVMLQLGVESGDQRVLDAMGKGFDLETASNVLNTLKAAGIATYVYLIFGTPSETIEEARKTLNFTVTHARKIDFLNLAIFNLPANSPEGKELERGNFYEGDLTLYRSFKHPKGWDRHLVRKFLNGEFRKHPAIAPIVRQSPPLFTSNHAPLFILHRQWRKECEREKKGYGA
jgi:hypothetical protein